MSRFSPIVMAAALAVVGAAFGYGDLREKKDDPFRDRMPPEWSRTRFLTKEVQGHLMVVEPDLAVVRNSRGAMNLELTPQTRIRIGLRDITVADLRPGMGVTAFYVQHRQRNIATTIIVESPVIVEISR